MKFARQTTILLSFILAAGYALAGSQKTIVMRAKANIEVQKNDTQIGKWTRSAAGSLKSRGISITEADKCEKFTVEIVGENLVYKLSCGSHFSSGLLPLTSGNNYHVERSKNEITVTKISYYGQKIQTSHKSQSLIRIPFVEEVTHVKFMTDGSLSFYKENFITDDFGRVVQKSFLQGFGLSKKLIKTARN